MSGCVGVVITILLSSYFLLDSTNTTSDGNKLPPMRNSVALGNGRGVRAWVVEDSCVRWPRGRWGSGLAQTLSSLALRRRAARVCAPHRGTAALPQAGLQAEALEHKTTKPNSIEALEKYVTYSNGLDTPGTWTSLAHRLKISMSRIVEQQLETCSHTCSPLTSRPYSCGVQVSGRKHL